MRNIIHDLFGGLDLFLNKKGRIFVFLFMLSFLIFSFNIIPDDITLVLALILFTVASTRTNIIMFAFFVLWDNVAVLSFGITLVFFMQIILFIKIVWTIFQNNIYTLIPGYYFIFVSIWAIYGLFAFLLYDSLSGFSIFFTITTILYSYYICRDKAQSFAFWKASFFVLMWSVLLSTNYGFYHDNSLDRWVRGVGSVSQIYGTLGTTRLGIFLVAGISYPLFFTKNRLIKIACIVILSALTLMTVSITAFACMIMYWGGFLCIKYMRKISTIIAIFIVTATTISAFWGVLRENRISSPVIHRIELSFSQAQSGDINKATSGREDLSEYYLEYFTKSSFFNKIIGHARVNFYNEDSNIGFAHNSYIDMLLYVGILGIFLFLIIALKRCYYFRNREEFLPIFLSKIVLLIAAATVSIMKVSYWPFWVLL